MSAERTISAAVKTAIGQATVLPFWLVFADFIDAGGAADPVRATTRDHDISWDGETWLGGLSDLLEIGDIVEATDGQSESVTITLDAIPSEWFDAITKSKYQGRTLEIYRGFLSATTLAVIVDPELAFSGQMNADRIVDDGELSTLTVEAVSKLSRQTRPRQYRYTHNDQALLWAGEVDDGLEFVAELQDVKLKWGTV
jgi:hypothetical protein